MADKMNKTTVLLVTAFVALIIGVSLIGVIGSEEQKLTTLTQVNDENVALVWKNDTHISNQTYTIANVYSTSTEQWKIDEDDCDMTARAIGLSNGTNLNTANYTFGVNGQLYIKGGTFSNASHIQASETLLGAYALDNKTYVDYSYCADDYTTESWTRNVLNIVIGFFAIALMVVSVGIFYFVLKEEGLTNL